MSKSLVDKIIDEMLDRIKNEDIFDEKDIENLETLTSQKKLSSETLVKQLIERENLVDENP